MALVLLDTTLLSNFAHVRRSDLLHAVFGADAATTPVVMAELRHGEALGLVPACDWTWLQVLEPGEDGLKLAGDLARTLDPGEAECLAAALSLNGHFLSDDFAARRMAASRGLVVSGTLGVLAMLVESGLLTLDEADELLQRMTDRGYRAPVRSLKDLLGGERYDNE
jgi:predicted nucleic acid-binding protein